MSLATALLVLLAAAAADFCWARYTSYAARGERWAAALWSVGIFATGSFAVIEYTTDHRYLPFAFAGAFLGTAVGVRRAA